MPFWQSKGKGLLVTGQTTSYAPTGTTDDDGGLEKGKARAYVALDAGNYSGTTSITVGAIADATHDNSCVIDNATGLMWNKEPTKALYHSGSAEHLLWDAEAEAGELANQDIFGFVDAANAASLSGHTDWRVPNVFEMMSILNYEAANANPDATYFGTVNGIYWTSTTRPNDTPRALNVNAALGLTGSVAKITTHNSVFLVRTN